MRPVLFTGCQRSGTAYTSAVFTTTGWWCSHERFHTERDAHPLRSQTIESSHAAAARLPWIYETSPDVLVYHLVRHPLDVISSLLAAQKFAGRRWALSARFAAKHLPSLTQRKKDSPLVRSMRYWVEWNTLVERNAAVVARVNVESITPHDVAAVLGMSERAGPHDLDRAAYALSLHSERVNDNPKDVKRLTRDDLPDVPLTRRLVKMADSYGYEL